MLTGTNPYPELSHLMVETIMYKIRSEDIIPKIPDNISNALKLFLKKCLNRNPNERSTIEELLKRKPYF
jgi:serine/threonine protein kinase